MTNTNTTETRTAAEFETALAAYVAALNAASVEEFAKQYPTLTASVYSVDAGGRKFLRIVSTVGGTTDQRSSHVFVERATGLIWKCASWKAPALNFPRGSIYDLATAVAKNGTAVRIGR